MQTVNVIASDIRRLKGHAIFSRIKLRNPLHDVSFTKSDNRVILSSSASYIHFDYIERGYYSL
jgi:hypothetical protein